MEITEKKNTSGNEKKIRYYLPSGYYILEAKSENSIVYVETYTQNTSNTVTKIILNNVGDKYILNWSANNRIAINENHTIRVEAIKYN